MSPELRLRASTRPRLLMVSHAFGGGVARHIAELAASIDATAEVLLLQPDAEGTFALRGLSPRHDLALWFQGERDWAALLAVLAALGIDRVHYHHVHGFPPAVLELAARLACPYDVTLHDYFPACPEYHLTGAGGRFCGGAPDCTSCTRTGPPAWPWTIPEWRQRLGEWLLAADRVIAPSADTAARMQRFFPTLAALTWPHARPAPLSPVRRARILVPGAISPAKGLALLEACVRDAARRGLPLHFRVLGYIASPIPAWPELPFSVSGEYREGELPALIASEGGDACFFPAQCPETHSYTLTDAMDSGLPIVATDLGALRARLEAHPGARVLPWDAAPAAFNDALLAATGAPGRAAPPPSPFESPAAYARRYLEPLAAQARAPRPELPVIEARWRVAPERRDPPTTTLSWLFRDAVLCGRGLSRDKLERRTREADDALERARAELAELRGSTSWKLTAPLRALVTALRGPRK